MLRDFAIIENNTIVNKIIIDDQDQGIINLFRAIPLPEGSDIGWIYLNEKWQNPNPPSIQEIQNSITIEEIDLILQSLADEESL